MENFKELAKLKEEFSFADIEKIVEVRPNVVIVKMKDVTNPFGISRRRIDKSSCEPTIKLRVDSHEGKYLIPEDSVESTAPNW